MSENFVTKYECAEHRKTQDEKNTAANSEMQKDIIKNQLAIASFQKIFAWVAGVLGSVLGGLLVALLVRGVL